MSNVYTKYVSNLGDDGRLPDEKLFDDVWAQLRKDVMRELGRRGLPDFPPSVLGIPGASWAEVMDELLRTVFVYVLVERLQILRNKLANCKNIDGIVVLQIRICLTDLQRRNDPIGYRVYELLLSAVTKSVADRELYVLDGKDGKITNATVLGFHPGMSPENPATPLADEGVHRWLDELLPDFMTARGSAVIPVVGRLRELVGELRNVGVEAFRFKDLVDPLKKETRRRWLAVYETTPTDAGTHRFADLHGLHRCVTGKIDLEGKKKTREDLARTWTFLRATQRERDGQLPSNVKLAREIGVDRSRVPSLLETLKRLVAECLSGQDHAPAGEPTAPRTLSDGERR